MVLPKETEIDSIAPLMFGIPQLDALMGYRQAENASDANSGKAEALHDLFGSLRRTSSLTIVGEDGAGKSVLALHIASTYAAMHHRATKSRNAKVPLQPPVIVYASSDFRFSAAETVWTNFYLDYPWLRYVPSIGAEERSFRHGELKELRPDGGKGCLHLRLVSCEPGAIIAKAYQARGDGPGSLSRDIHFIDLAEKSTGDDWRYLSSVLAAMPRRKGPRGFIQPPNLLIVDSVAGFETLIGQTNTFGQESSRRSRITQILKAASDSWHVVLVSEEPEGMRHHPEEYVTDTVIHLRRHGSQEKVRRLLEIEKSRARDIAQGEHPFEIRDGNGSSTRSWENPDDPATLLHPEAIEFLNPSKSKRRDHNSYVQVFPSLHYLSKQFGRRHSLLRTEGRSLDRSVTVPFGIEYLDNLLLPAQTNGPGGLPGATITALIGEEGTRKVYLAEEFLIAAYEEFPEILTIFLELSKRYLADRSKIKPHFSEYVRQRGKGVVDDGPYCLSDLSRKRLLRSFKTFGDGLHDVPLLNEIGKGCYKIKDPKGAPLKNRWALIDFVEELSGDARKTAAPGSATSILTLAYSALRLITGVLAPTVFVATHDSSRENLVERIFARQKHELEPLLKPFVDNDSERLSAYMKYLRRVLEGWITVRRVELVDSTSPQLWHVIEGAVIQGIHGLGYKVSDISSNVEPQESAEQVRVVISDLRLIRDTYPAVAADPLFLPTLVFRLKRLGVTTIIVESDNGRLDRQPTHAMSGALRSLVDHQINTWKVNFFGEQRVAIAVLPSAGTSSACLIRELRYTDKQNSQEPPRLIVDPIFEIFENIDEGKPNAVRLQIQLYNETPAFQKYVESEQGAFNLIFSPEAEDSAGVVRMGASSDYSALRDYSHLPMSRKLPFTLVFMVDGHWALGLENALRIQYGYLFDPLPPSNAIRFEDPFKLFVSERVDGKPVQRLHRADLFKQDSPGIPNVSAYKLRIGETFKTVDRVPFMWDFGFLICSKDRWERAADSKLCIRRYRDHVDRPSVGNVFSRLGFPSQVPRHILPKITSRSKKAVPWREFFEACKLVAQKETMRTQKPCRTFDVASTSPESITCMMLEIWLSEVFQDVLRFESLIRTKNASAKLKEDARIWITEARRFLHSMSSEVYEDNQKGKPRLEDLLKTDVPSGRQITAASNTQKRHYGLRDQTLKPLGTWNDEDRALAERFCLVKAVGKYSLHLYQAWLLLLEVLDFSSFLNDEPIEYTSTLGQHDSAVSVRHWYKTACAASLEKSRVSASSDEILQTNVPVKLPGYFSARGDWFLAAANGSRSGRLAEQAMDILNSRRANRTRLHLGLGLPVRDLIPGQEIGKIRTGLRVTSPTEEFAMSYGGILEMGGSFFPRPNGRRPRDTNEFFWLFRTGFQNYDRQAMAIARWLQKMFAWTVQLRFKEAHNWDGGFHAYDDLSQGMTTVVSKIRYKSWEEFFEFLKVFRADLIACRQEFRAHDESTESTQDDVQE